MNAPRRSRSFWRGLFSLFAWLLVFGLVALAALCYYAFRDRNPDYSLDVQIEPVRGDQAPRALQVGFGRIKITPDLAAGRPVWLAGFSQNRAATGVHDDLWAIACVIDDGRTRIGFAALDAIGFFHDDVIAVRERLGGHLKLDYTVICSTHNHSTPDLMGLWGPTFYQTGVDGAYREQVISATARAFADAVDALQPARIAFYEIPVKPEGLLTDTRKPEVYDPNLRVMHFVHQVDGSTIGTLVTWANHPETPWSRNTEITADFPGYLRDALEHGVRERGALVAPGLGGMHLYINGAIGGLMTTSPKVTVRDPYTGLEYKEPSHDKARALGRQLASRILPPLQQLSAPPQDNVSIGVQARTFQVPVSNKLFLLAPVLGLIDRGHPGIERWNQLRSEVAVVTVGDASIACVPGEIYPELVNGGAEHAPGGDFNMDPIELPPLRDLLPGKIKFIFGLANDEIGYIIPKSEWDEQPPYLYGADKRVYGEVNSVGPNAALTIHTALRQLCAPLRKEPAGTE